MNSRSRLGTPAQVWTRTVLPVNGAWTMRVASIAMPTSWIVAELAGLEAKKMRSHDPRTLVEYEMLYANTQLA